MLSLGLMERLAELKRDYDPFQLAYFVAGEPLRNWPEVLQTAMVENLIPFLPRDQVETYGRRYLQWSGDLRAVEPFRRWCESKHLLLVERGKVSEPENKEVLHSLPNGMAIVEAVREGEQIPRFLETLGALMKNAEKTKISDAPTVFAFVADDPISLAVALLNELPDDEAKESPIVDAENLKILLKGVPREIKKRTHALILKSLVEAGERGMSGPQITASHNELAELDEAGRLNFYREVTQINKSFAGIISELIHRETKKRYWINKGEL